ncbi:hypothetical protein OCAR_4953 [Afipia carboxidovorans OM5]|nr:hypothetical protein OCAR_4953 [Afipia carboxidovorans OM5]
MDGLVSFQIGVLKVLSAHPNGRSDRRHDQTRPRNAVLA